MSGKPLLLMDIDGPLNPWAGQWVKHADQCERKGFKIASIPFVDSHQPPLKVRYGIEHGARLKALSEFYDLVWASAWNDLSDTLYGPLIGLTGLPHVDFPEDAMKYHPNREHWKCFHIARLIRDVGAPGALWFDDEVTKRDQRWMDEALPEAKVNVMRVREHEGLRDFHFDYIERWARENF